MKTRIRTTGHKQTGTNTHTEPQPFIGKVQVQYLILICKKVKMKNGNIDLESGDPGGAKVRTNITQVTTM